MFIGLTHTSLIHLLWLSASFVNFEYSAGQIYKVIGVISGYIDHIRRDIFCFLFKQSTCNVSKYAMIWEEKKSNSWWHIQCWPNLKGHLNKKIPYVVFIHQLWKDKYFAMNMHKQGIQYMHFFVWNKHLWWFYCG